MPKKLPSEKASFVIVNGETSISFKVDGNVIGAIGEAFTWLTPERRERLMDRLATSHKALLAKEAARAQSKQTESAPA